MSKKHKQRKFDHNNSKKMKNRDSDDSDSEKEEQQQEMKHKKPKKNNDEWSNTASRQTSQVNIASSNLPPPNFDNLKPVRKCFWEGPMELAGATDATEAPSTVSTELKELRKSLGINVKGNTASCPPPVTRLSTVPLATSSSASSSGACSSNCSSSKVVVVAFADNYLPTSFQQVFAHLHLSTPSVVQMQAWPALLTGANVLCISPTGSGKTLAYSLPAIPHMQTQALPQDAVVKRKGPLVLVLVPTRELAIQVSNDLKPLQRLFHLRSLALYGGADKSSQIEALQHTADFTHTGCPEIIVATPGRLLDLCVCGNIVLTTVTYLAIDEADRMLALGFAAQLDTIASQLRPDRQTSLFSATFPGKLREACLKWCGGTGEEYVIIRCGSVEIEQTNTRALAEIEKSQTQQQTALNTQLNAQQQTQQQATEAIIKPKEKQMQQQQQQQEESSLTSSSSSSSTKKRKAESDPATDDNGSDQANSQQQQQQSSTSTSSSLTSLALTINKSIVQSVHVCAEHKKPRLLIHFIDRVRAQERQENAGKRQRDPMLIFCTHIKTVKFVYEFLVKQQISATATKKTSGGSQQHSQKPDSNNNNNNKRDQPIFGEKYGVGLLHGQMLQSDRERTLANFKAGKLNILVATDVAARGVHIKNLKYVINYDFPSNLEQYCHRIGRTGRVHSSAASTSETAPAQQAGGYAYSLLTRNLGPLSKDLIEFLKACGQPIEPNLQRLADSVFEPNVEEDEEGEEDAQEDQDGEEEEGGEERDEDVEEE